MVARVLELLWYIMVNIVLIWGSQGPGMFEQGACCAM
jgi:hypothetical protein